MNLTSWPASGSTSILAPPSSGMSASLCASERSSELVSARLASPTSPYTSKMEAHSTYRFIFITSGQSHPICVPLRALSSCCRG
ncbi:hypothetical protein KSP39_PZI006073 [Platanthera zijinensis]|uniref:Uncharacterized protein n=1 Tax=Platanthera zijinensis TaxID=2320716 RepID=A0AAP0GBQ9_9ASPA